MIVLQRVTRIMKKVWNLQEIDGSKNPVRSDEELNTIQIFGHPTQRRDQSIILLFHWVPGCRTSSCCEYGSRKLSDHHTYRLTALTTVLMDFKCTPESQLRYEHLFLFMPIKETLLPSTKSQTPFLSWIKAWSLMLRDTPEARVLHRIEIKSICIMKQQNCCLKS